MSTVRPARPARNAPGRPRTAQEATPAAIPTETRGAAGRPATALSAAPWTPDPVGRAVGVAVALDPTHAARIDPAAVADAIGWSPKYAAKVISRARAAGRWPWPRSAQTRSPGKAHHGRASDAAIRRTAASLASRGIPPTADAIAAELTSALGLHPPVHRSTILAARSRWMRRPGGWPWRTGRGRDASGNSIAQARLIAELDRQMGEGRERVNLAEAARRLGRSHRAAVDLYHALPAEIRARYPIGVGRCPDERARAGRLEQVRGAKVAAAIAARGPRVFARTYRETRYAKARYA